MSSHITSEKQDLVQSKEKALILKQQEVFTSQLNDKKNPDFTKTYKEKDEIVQHELKLTKIQLHGKSFLEDQISRSSQTNLKEKSQVSPISLESFFGKPEFLSQNQSNLKSQNQIEKNGFEETKENEKQREINSTYDTNYQVREFNMQRAFQTPIGCDSIEETEIQTNGRCSTLTQNENRHINNEFAFDTSQSLLKKNRKHIHTQNKSTSYQKHLRPLYKTQYQKQRKAHKLEEEKVGSRSRSPMSISECSSLKAGSSTYSISSLLEFKSADLQDSIHHLHPSGQNAQIFKSPRLSPLQSLDRFFSESFKKVNSDFPYSKRKIRGNHQSYLMNKIIESLPEMVEEEKKEDENPVLQRQSRFSIMRDLNEFGNRTGGANKRHRSLDGIKKKNLLAVSKNLHFIQSQYVSETDEELISDEDDKHRNSYKKIFSLGYLSKLMNRKIYSDYFDVSFESQNIRRQQQLNTRSVIECPISEDVESESQKDFLSDNSSSSTFSLRKKKISFDLSKLIDRLEPSLDESSNIGSKYYGKINDTIEEEEDDKDEQQIDYEIVSPRVRNSRKAQHDKVSGFRFLDKYKSKPKKIKSICLESEPILEELEEYYPCNDVDQMNHTFIINGRARLNSSENAISSENIENQNQNNNNNNTSSLAPIQENKEEKEEDTTQLNNSPKYVQELTNSVIEESKHSSSDQELE